MVIIYDLEILSQWQTPHPPPHLWHRCSRREGRNGRGVYSEEVRRIKYMTPCQHFSDHKSIFLHLSQPHISPKMNHPEYTCGLSSLHENILSIPENFLWTQHNYLSQNFGLK